MLNTSLCRILSRQGGGYVASCLCINPFTSDRSQAALFTPEQAIAKAADLNAAGHDHLRLDFGFELDGFDQVSDGSESVALSDSI
jgi:hypothetical protein